MKSKFYPGGSEEDRLLFSRVGDAAQAAGRNPRFLGFLDMHEQAVARSALASLGEGCCSYLFWGGFEGAERVYLGISAEVQPVAEDFPIAAVRFSWRFEALTHRDFLGALLSLGLRRDKIGDIVVGDGECRVVLDAGISDFVRQNLTKVGGGGVSCVAAGLTDIKKRQAFGAVSDTIASPRLDCIVAALADKSRLDAGKLILNGFVSIDFETAEDTAAKLNEGSTVSIRGHGRFIIDGIGPATKKGRLRLEARKYL